jgi:hypothetical protein
MTFEKQCCACNTIHVITVEDDKYRRWREGELIQNVWPEKSIVDREIMISGTCGPCFDQLFKEDSEW